MKTITGFLLALLLCTPSQLTAECGVNKPFEIYVQRSYHRDNVEVPVCHTSEGSCKVSGTVFVVSSKKVKFTILLADGTKGHLEIGESYSVILSCGTNAIMMPLNDAGEVTEASGAFSVLEQEAIDRSRAPSKNKS